MAPTACDPGYEDTPRLGSSKQGDRYLRRLLIVGALSAVKSARARPDKYPWIMTLLGRRPAKVIAVALANKMARPGIGKTRYWVTRCRARESDWDPICGSHQGQRS